MSESPNHRSMLIFGLVLLAAGAAGVWAFGYQPYHDGMAHEPKVSLSLSGLMFSAVFLVLAGLMLLPIGPAPTATPGPGGKLPIPWRAWIFYTLLILVALGAIIYYFWLRSVLRDQGYDL